MEFAQKPLFPPSQITTERLVLRLPHMRDAASLFHAYMSDIDVTRHLLWRPHESPETTRFFLANTTVAWAEGEGHRPWVIEERGHADPVPLGMIGTTIAGHAMEIGYVLRSDAQGRGYMTEALNAVVQTACLSAEIIRIFATCHPENIASQRLLERCEFIREGRLRKFQVYPNISGEPTDVFLYARVCE